MTNFDAIVVGAGVAGSVAALVMARAGLDVLVIERGDSAGCKNMTGGRLYAHTLEAIIPGFAASAPVERQGHTRENLLLNQRECRYPRFSPRAIRMFRNTRLIPYCVIVWTRG
ncbi:putative flavoprotein [Escherichia coli]|uniref:Protein FixC n=1 Tax=Escherichia coli TaxID=562 RepID=A0A376LN61_ECOLX|nr:putative flavoprotein [Escherichia coli]